MKELEDRLDTLADILLLYREYRKGQGDTKGIIRVILFLIDGIQGYMAPPASEDYDDAEVGSI